MKFSKGDRVRCIPGFLQGRDKYSDGGGAGYIENLVFTIAKLAPPLKGIEYKGPLYAGLATNGYVFESVLELAYIYRESDMTYATKAKQIRIDSYEIC